MGSIFSKVYNFLSELASSEPRSILMFGLDSAGKTTILYKIKINENVSTIPTIGFNVEQVKIGKGLTFTIWDVGGQMKIRRLYHHYLSTCQALMFVIDSQDRERLVEAKEELFNILSFDDTKEIPIIVLANKQDLPNAMLFEEVVDGLGLRDIGQTHKWHVQLTCAISGDGLYEAMEMMSKMSTDFMKTHKQNLK